MNRKISHSRCAQRTSSSRLVLAATLITFSILGLKTALAQFPPLGGIDLLAGGSNGDGGPATDTIVDPIDVATRRVGSVADLYIADLNGHRVRRVDGSSGIITTVAGTGLAGFSGDGAAALNATLDSVNALTVTPDGTLYICANNRIRKVNTAGVITTVAGNGGFGDTGDNGPATQASIGYCRALTVDALGAVYMADSDFHVVRRVNTSGIITTVAGNGTRGDSGDGGPATAANFLTPYGIDFDGSGNLYILDHDAFAVRRVDTNGIITTYAGSHLFGYYGDGLQALQAKFNYPNKIAVDAGGNLLILDGNNNRLRRVSAATGIITTIAGNGTAGAAGDGGPGTQAQLLWPNALAADELGNAYLGNRSTVIVPFSYDNRVRRLDASGIITTVAALSSNGDGELATQAVLNPYGLATGNGPTPALYFVDRMNQQVRKIDGTTRIVSTLAGTTAVSGFSGDGGRAIFATLSGPTNVLTDGNGQFWISDTNNNRVRYIDTSGNISTVVGTGIAGYSGDGGLATNARLFNPQGLARDGAGNLYIADRLNNRIRKVSGGIITTIAGTGTAASTGDGGLATAAQLQYPNSVAVGSDGSVYIAESYRIRAVRPTGIIVPVVGNGSTGFSGDGGPALTALINGPNGLSLDSSGNLFFFDWGNNRARKIDSAGIITTVAGSGSTGNQGDGGPATIANLYPANGIAVDTVGHLYLAQSDSLSIRFVSLQAGILPTPTPPASTPTRTSTPVPTNSPTVTRTSTAVSTPTRTFTPPSTAVFTASRTATPLPTTTPTISSGSYSVGGQILYYSNAQPVTGAVVQINGPAALSTQTDVGGQFTCPDAATCTSLAQNFWTAIPTKNGGGSAAITALDAVKALNAATGLVTLGNNDFIACDVNGSGNVSAIDASLILQYRVGLISKLPVATNCGGDWAFRPASPDPEPNQVIIQPQMPGACQPGAIAYNPLVVSARNQNFTGILFGDCNGSWTTLGGGGSVDAAAKVRLGLPRRHDTHIVVPVSIDASAPVHALEFRVDYDGTLLGRPVVHRHATTQHALVQANRQMPGSLTVAVASIDPLPNGEVLWLQFDARTPRLHRDVLRLTHATVE